MKTYNDGHLHEPESELDELSFVTPAKESPSGPCENIDDVFGSHIRMPGSILDEGSSDPFNDYQIYPIVWLCIAIKIVVCGKWAIELGFPLSSVSDGDESLTLSGSVTQV